MAAPIEKQLSIFCEEKNLFSKRQAAYNSPSFDQVDNLSYTEFFENYLQPNRPCIFSPKTTENWKSRQKWVTENGQPNFDYLRNTFGAATVPVANCKQEQYSSHPKCEMTMTEYLDYWQTYIQAGYPQEHKCLYLKDWHFTKAFPDYGAYDTPVYFQSDWLNEFCDTKTQDDYRFVYMGPKGTWTPFHSDVYRSFSWSANICGRKKWIFYPPGCEESLKDKFGQLIYDITSSDLHDPNKYSMAAQVKDKSLEVIQEQGQMIFVPSGWHHQVFNLEDTISINHNWLNGCNIDICWRHLQDSLVSVQKEISDSRDMDGWEQQCQLILNVCSGLDYKTFVDLLHVITKNRLTALKQTHKVDNNSAQTVENVSEKLVGEVGFDENQTKIATSEKCDTGKCNKENLLMENCDAEPGNSVCGKMTDLSIKENSLKVNTDTHKIHKKDTELDCKDEIVDFIEEKEIFVNKGINKFFDQETESVVQSNDGAFNLHAHSKGKVAQSSDQLVKQLFDRQKQPTISRDSGTHSGKAYLLYDLECIRKVVTDIIDDKDYQQIKPEFTVTAEAVLEMIKICFKEMDINL